MSLLPFMSEAHKGMVMRVVDWTPPMSEYAFTTLNTHENQKKFNQPTAEKYQRIMLADEWRQPWPQCCIAFSTDGVLLNGQHTLWAVWKSGRTIRINTAWNLTNEDFLLFDNFKTRNLGQLAKQAGLGNTSIRNGIAKLVMGHDHDMGPSVQVTVEDTIRITVDDVLMNSMVTYVVNVRKRARTSEVALTYALYKIANVHGLDAACEFFERVSNGNNLDSNDPRLHLNRFLNNRSIKSWDQRTQVIIGIIKAFNAWMSGTPMQVLSVRPSESIPNVIGASLIRSRSRVAGK